MIPSFRTERPGQTELTQIRLLLEEPFCHSVCIFWTHYSMVQSHDPIITAIFFVCPNIQELYHTCLRNWLFAVLGSPTIQILMSPRSFVISWVTLGTPPNNIKRIPLFISSLPEQMKNNTGPSYLKTEPEHGKIAWALSEDLDQFWHLPSLIRFFTVHLKMLWSLATLTHKAHSEE